MHAIAILYPGCIEFEIMLAIELIGRAFDVRIATPDGADHRRRRDRVEGELRIRRLGYLWSRLRAYSTRRSWQRDPER